MRWLGSLFRFSSRDKLSYCVIVVVKGERLYIAGGAHVNAAVGLRYYSNIMRYISCYCVVAAGQGDLWGTNAKHSHLLDEEVGVSASELEVAVRPLVSVKQVGYRAQAGFGPGGPLVSFKGFIHTRVKEQGLVQ